MPNITIENGLELSRKEYIYPPEFETISNENVE